MATFRGVGDATWTTCGDAGDGITRCGTALGATGIETAARLATIGGCETTGVAA